MIKDIILILLATGGSKVKKSSDLWAEVAKQEEFKEEFLLKWRDLQLDLCISPSFVCPAPQIKHVGKLHGIYFSLISTE